MGALCPKKFESLKFGQTLGIFGRNFGIFFLFASHIIFLPNRI